MQPARTSRGWRFRALTPLARHIYRAATRRLRVAIVDLKARFYLHGLLAQIPTLCAGDTESAAVVRAWCTRIQFSVAGGPSAGVTFRRGTATFDSRRCTLAGLSLWYPSAAAVVRAFAGDGSPIPVLGVWRPGLIRGLRALTSRLGYYMRLSQPAAAERDADLSLALRMRLDALLRSVAAVGTLDARAGAALEEAPDGSVVVRAPGVRSICARKIGRVLCMLAEEPAEPSLVLEFDSVSSGHDLLAGRLEASAAIGLRVVRLRGLTPLADAIFNVVGDVQTLMAS